MTVDRLPTTAALCTQAVALGRVLGGYLFVQHRDEIVVDTAFGEAEPGSTALIRDVGELRCAVKPLTTVCIAQAVDAGLLGLDDTLDRWTPPNASTRVAGLSLRRLLQHTSGLPNFFSPDVYSTGFDAYTTSIFRAPFPAGTWEHQPIYNTVRSWHLLAWVLQKVYAQPIQDVIAELVTRPLNMVSTGLLDPEMVSRPYQRRTADHGYQAFHDADAATFATRPNPAYGGFATTADLGRLYHHLLRCLTDGDGLVRPATMRLLVRPQGGVRFRPRDQLLPFGTGFFLGGGAAGFGGEWDADSFGHMGSVRSYYGIGALCAPRSRTVVAVRLASIGRAGNVFLRSIGRTIHQDLALGAPE